MIGTCLIAGWELVGGEWIRRLGCVAGCKNGHDFDPVSRLSSTGGMKVKQTHLGYEGDNEAAALP